MNYSQQIFFILLIFKISEIYSGKIYTTANEKKYYIENNQSYTWFDAYYGCLNMNMTLASIDTSAKSEEVNTLVLGNFGRIDLWIGGIVSRYPKSSKYIWITTGQEITSTFWHDSYPQFSSTSDELCLTYGITANMKWANWKCTIKNGFICEEHPHDITFNENMQTLEKQLQEYQQQLKIQDQLKQNLTNLQQELIKQKELEQQQKELVQQLKEQLQQHKENDMKSCKENLKTEIKWKRNTVDENWLKQQLELGEKLQRQTETFQEFLLQKQQERLNCTEEEIKENMNNDLQSNEDEYKKYRNVIFQFQHNTYFQVNGQKLSHESNQTLNETN